MSTRIAVFGDLHANLAATEAFLADIGTAAPDTVYCLGDLVGYGPCPTETVALIQKRGIPTIMGNYDDGVGFDRDDCGCAYKGAAEEARPAVAVLDAATHGAPGGGLPPRAAGRDPAHQRGGAATRCRKSSSLRP